MFLLLLSLLTPSAQAAPDSALLKAAVEAQGTCQNSLRTDDNNLYVSFGTYREGTEDPRVVRPGKVRVAPLQDPAHGFELATQDGVIDTATRGNKLYALTYTNLEVWDLSGHQRTKLVPAYNHSGPGEYMEHARGIALYGDKAIIAHGRLGVSFFDLKSETITHQFRLAESFLPLESMAMDVTVEGKFAYVVMDGFDMPQNGKHAFKGVIVIDMESEKVVAELDGMDPGVDNVVSDSRTLIASFWGMPLWTYDLASLRGKSIPNPRARVFKFPFPGHPIGKPSMDAQNYYTCYRLQGEKPGEGTRFVPKVFSRADLGLL